MSPKSNRSGASYDENDPRGLSMPAQREGEQGPRVTRATDFDAAAEGLKAPRPDDDRDQHEETCDKGEQRLGGLEEVQSVQPQADRSGWSKKQLNEELDKRKIEHDPKASNPVLVDLLEADDEHRAQHGDGAGAPPQNA